MAFRYTLLLFSLVLFFVFVVGVLAEASSAFASFGFNNFEGKSEYFESRIGLFGDAKVDENGSFVQITQSKSFSAGRVMYKRPIKELEINESMKVSFGTYFSFSLSPQNGDGIVFVMLPNGYSSKGYNGKLFGLTNELIQKNNRVLFAVEFDTKMDAEFGDLDDNHVGVNLGSSLVSVKVANSSVVKLGLKSGKRLQCWIDYEASSKRIEVRLCKSGEERPVYPVLSYAIDLSDLFKNKELYIGLSSSNANSTQVCKLYSWSFKLRQVPNWMHSEPADPQTKTKDTKVVSIRKRSDCTVKVLSALFLGTACGALGAYIVMFLWSVFVTKKPVAPEEYVVNKPVLYDYDKAKVVAVDIPDDGAKK